MPPRAITSPKKKRSKRKGSDASGRAGLAEAGAVDSAAQCSGHPNAGTGGRNSQLEKIGAILESSGSHPPKGSTSLGSNIPVNPQAPEPARKGQKGHSKAVPLPYNSLNITNGPASSIDNTGPGFSMQQPGGRFGFVAPPSTEHSLQETHNTVGLKAVKKRAKKVASDQTPCNIVPSRTTFMEHQLDPALFKEDDNVRHQSALRESKLLDSMAKSSSIDDSDGEEDKDREEDGEREEDESDSDKDTSESQYQHRNDHLGFSKESLPSQPRVTCHLTPEFDFQYSRNEDDTAAQMSINKSTVANSQSSLPVQRNSDSQGSLDPPTGAQQQQCSEPSDVLEHHHKKNGWPRLPDPESLELLHQLAECADDQQAPQRNRKTKQSDDGPKPTLLAWYGPRWKSFLEHTKGECRVEHTLEDPFPTFVDDLPRSVTEVLIATLVAWDKEGKHFEAELKKTAIGLAPLVYSLIPPASVPPQERATWVKSAVSQLLAESKFLRFGLDELGRTELHRRDRL
ncbi:hypothetical protein EV702DRAFT_1048936 [Suillus placidus]|uniref:Uncharacterized protein n=1 Tax=Suillus placidus TaxID=48579 RepID=A0A9P7CYU9_9AGAM|nr:hypothetical protein EV702DRAFT_1048936 [Suillus placidus]